jgi:hypothetical protein
VGTAGLLKGLLKVRYREVLFRVPDIDASVRDPLENLR